MDWSSFGIGVVVGVLVVVIGTYLTEFVRPIGQDHSRRLRIWRKSRRARRRSEAARRSDEDERRQLELERVGTRWLYRASPDDPGMNGEVIELDAKAWKRRVIVMWSNPLGRAPTEDDPSKTRMSMEWRDLAKSLDDQRHWTARVRLNSDDDLDGWIMYERVSPPEVD